MGIAEARESARAMRAEVRKGADPVAERRRQRAIGRDARDGIGTVTALLELYAKQKGRRSKAGRSAGAGLKAYSPATWLSPWRHSRRGTCR
jgi:hypothetical protein